MPPADPLNDLLQLVRSAAREGVVEALQAQVPVAPRAVAPLVDKRMLAHALGVSIPSVDRLCRSQRIPYVLVGEVRRFDLEAVREALRASAPGPVKVERPSPPAPACAPCSEELPIPGVRLLSRHGGSR
jgi:hypothetical protein